MNRVLLPLALTLLSPVSAATPPPVSTLLTPGRVPVELLGPVYAPDIVDISRRMQAAAREDFDRFLEQLRNAKPGEPLPYDSRLGVTREEYQRFLDAKPTYTVYARSTLTVSRRPDGTLVLQGGRGLEGLSGVVLDPRQNRVRTRYGWTGVGEPFEYAATDNLGPRAGHSWKSEEGDLDRGNITTASLAIMRLEKTGQPLVTFNSGRSVSWQLKEHFNATFTLPVQGSSSTR